MADSREHIGSLMQKASAMPRLGLDRVEEGGRHNRGARGEIDVPARQPIPAGAPSLIGEAEIEIGERAADTDLADAEGGSGERGGFVLEPPQRSPPLYRA